MKLNTKEKLIAGLMAVYCLAISLGFSVWAMREQENKALFEPAQKELILKSNMNAPKERVSVLTADQTEMTQMTPEIDETDLELLAITIYCEAGSDYISDETRIMVGNVVMNRVADDRFPDTIYDVIVQRGQYGQFYWDGIRWPDRAEHEPEAVQRAYDCAERVLTGETLLTNDVVWQSEYVQGTEVVAHQDGLYFCR